MGTAVQVRLETHALFIDLAQFAKAEDLKPATVSQDRSVPVHELVQPAEPRHAFVTGAQVQMVGVAEDDLDTDLLQLLRQHPFDRALGADRHEGRCFNPAPACVYRATACLCIMTQVVQLEFQHLCTHESNIFIFFP